MKTPIIVNESTNPTEPGCVYVFSSLALAERYFEPWYANESYFACDADGLPLSIVSSDVPNRVSIVIIKDEPPRPELATKLIRAYLKSIALNKNSKDVDISDSWLNLASAQDIRDVSLRYATE